MKKFYTTQYFFALLISFFIQQNCGAQLLTTMYNKATDAPVLVVFGQSNAEGYTQPLAGADTARFGVHLKNVHGLSRANNLSACNNVVWDGYCVGDLNNNLLTAGKRPVLIGMHWNQWKVENQTGSMQSPHDVVDQYTSFFDGFKQAWGGAAFSIMLYKPRSTLYTRNFWGGNSTHFDDLVNGFNLLNVSTPSIYQLIDVSESTYVYGNHYYNSTTPDFTHGIFNSADTVH